MTSMEQKNNTSPFLVIHPGEMLQDELEARGLTQTEFSEIIDSPLRTVNEIIKGKRAITLETARVIGAALDTSADLWLGMQAEYDLFKLRKKSKEKEDEVRMRSTLYSLFPIPEMIKRGYLPKKKKVNEIKEEVLKTLGLSSIDDFNNFNTCFALFRTSKTGDIMENYLKTWILLGKKRATSLKIANYNRKKLEEFALEVKNISVEAKGGVSKVVEGLNNCGVRVIFLPHFSKTRVDGAVVWATRSEPIIIMSLRFDRIDNFYFTILHEIGHILKHPNEYFYDDLNNLRDGAKEQEADSFAASTLALNDVVQQLRDKKISTVVLLKKSKEINIHPGILVGRLQHENILTYLQYRQALIKIRDTVPAELVLQ